MSDPLYLEALRELDDLYPEALVLPPKPPKRESVVGRSLRQVLREWPYGKFEHRVDIETYRRILTDSTAFALDTMPGTWEQCVRVHLPWGPGWLGVK